MTRIIIILRKILIIALFILQINFSDNAGEITEQDNYQLTIGIEGFQGDSTLAAEAYIFTECSDNFVNENEYILGKFTKGAFRFLITKQQNMDKDDNVLLAFLPKNEPKDYTISSLIIKTTKRKLYNLCTHLPEQEISLTASPSFMIAPKIHKFIKKQDVVLTDADGEKFTSHLWGVAYREDSDEYKQYAHILPHFMGNSHAVLCDNPDSSHLSFPVYFGMRYHVFTTPEYGIDIDTPEEPWNFFLNQPLWHCQIDTPIVSVRLLVKGMNPSTQDFTSDKYLIEFDKSLQLVVTQKPEDTSEYIDVFSFRKGFLRFTPSESFQRRKHVYFHITQYDFKANRYIPVYKVLNPIVSLPQDKRNLTINLFVEPLSATDADIPETNIIVKRMGTSNIIESAYVCLVNPPHNSINIKTTRLNLPPGKHRLLFHAQGYRLLEREITVLEKGKNTIVVEMDPVQPPLKIAFDGPADTPAEQILLQYRYDAYPFLGVLQARSLKPDKGQPSLGLSLKGGKGEALVDIDAAQAFTLCASALPSPKFVANKDSVSMPLPLMLYRHDRVQSH